MRAGFGAALIRLMLASIAGAGSAVIGSASLLRSARRLGPLRLDLGGASLARLRAPTSTRTDIRPVIAFSARTLCAREFEVDFSAMTFELTPRRLH